MIDSIDSIRTQATLRVLSYVRSKATDKTLHDKSTFEITQFKKIVQVLAKLLLVPFTCSGGNLICTPATDLQGRYDVTRNKVAFFFFQYVG
jgi:hypothetical protein